MQSLRIHLLALGALCLLGCPGSTSTATWTLEYTSNGQAGIDILHIDGPSRCHINSLDGTNIISGTYEIRPDYARVTLEDTFYRSGSVLYQYINFEGAPYGSGSYRGNGYLKVCLNGDCDEATVIITMRPASAKDVFSRTPRATDDAIAGAFLPSLADSPIETR